MKEQSMRDRIAKAIAAVNLHEFPVHRRNSFDERYRQEADAALDALSEPTPEMVDAMVIAFGPTKHGEIPATYIPRIKRTFTAAIREAAKVS